MTEQEAITIIKCEKEHHSEYSVIGEALQMAIQALEKQIPKKWIAEDLIDGTGWKCPYCNTGWTLFEGTPRLNKYNYCPKCGQALEEEVRSCDNCRWKGTDCADAPEGLRCGDCTQWAKEKIED